jgi:alpha-1,6-mannosyltransferase
MHALVLLILAGAVLEVTYLALWVFGYPISQAPDWSVAFLTQHEVVWDAFKPFLEAAQARWPVPLTETETLTNVLMLLFTVAYAAYGLALWAARGLSGRVVMAEAIFWGIIHQATLLVMPGLFTTDLFSYATYGRLPAIYGLNPFIHYPALVPFDTIASWIHPVWHYAPSVYGPLWIDFSVLMARASANMTPADQVFLYRLTANLAHVLNGALVMELLRPFGLRAMAAGFLLYAWNPMVAFEFAGNGHNDAVMLTFILAGLLATRHVHPSLGIALVTLAALIKPSAVLVLPLFAWLWVRQEGSWTGRLGAALGTAAITAGLAALLYYPWYRGPDTFGPLILWSTVSPMYINYVPDFLSLRIVERLMLSGVPWEQAWLDARERVKLGTRIVFVAYFLGELWYLRKLDDLPAACARVFLAFLLLVNTWVLAWYFTWSLAMVAVVPYARWLKLAAIGMTYSAITVVYYHHFMMDLMPREYYALYLLPLAPPLLAALASWLRRERDRPVRPVSVASEVGGS